MFKSKPELQIVQLPAKAELVAAIPLKASYLFGQNHDRDTLILNFLDHIGGHVINARGLSVMWEGTMATTFPNNLSKVQSEMETVFPGIVRAIVPKEIANEAIKIRQELLNDQSLIAARSALELRTD